MITDWAELAKKIGSIHKDGESGGDDFTKEAFDEIFGDEWIHNAVDHIISFKKGYFLASNCLRYLSSKKAISYTYEVYKTSSGERAQQCVWLIKEIANPISIEWVEEFLNDSSVIGLGLGLLDQLLWTRRIPFDERTKSLLKMADINSKGQLKERIEFILKYINERNIN